MLLWGLALALPPVQAQTPGEVRGSVVDAHGGEALARVVVQLVGGAQPGRFGPDNRIRRRIEGVAASKQLDTQRVFFDLRTPARQRHRNQVAEQLAMTLGGGESGAGENLLHWRPSRNSPGVS